jgi:hypothetical protein
MPSQSLTMCRWERSPVNSETYARPAKECKFQSLIDEECVNEGSGLNI